jgi:alpha-galactosidase
MTDEMMPHYDGKPVQAPVTYGSWGGMSAEEHLKRITNIKEQKLPYDYYWIDADWYGPDKKAAIDLSESKWAINVGNWRFNKMLYPQGMKPISDTAHKAGMKFLLWVEPERAIGGTPITMEHPEWFLDELGRKQGTEGCSLLLNLGNPEAWKWCVELIAGMIKEQWIDCYRQDFNFNPLPYWQANDAPDRVGMTEIRHIEGLYAFWDELHLRFPNLLIDNCASGGRRLDFEMMRRSIPLWASDMQCFADYITERNQQQVYGLSLWIPQFSFGTGINHPGDTYHFRSTMAAGIVAHLFGDMEHPINPEYPYQWLRDRLAEYHRAKVYFSGDFYPLMKQSDSFEDWSVFQFDRQDLGSGILECFRKKKSPIEKVCPQLRGLKSSDIYEIEDVDSKQIFKISGHELMEKGWPVEIANRRDSRLFFYHLVNGTKE